MSLGSRFPIGEQETRSGPSSSSTSRTSKKVDASVQNVFVVDERNDQMTPIARFRMPPEAPSSCRKAWLARRMIEDTLICEFTAKPQLTTCQGSRTWSPFLAALPAEAKTCAGFGCI
jgi:hypothetical protein